LLIDLANSLFASVASLVAVSDLERILFLSFSALMALSVCFSMKFTAVIKAYIPVTIAPTGLATIVFQSKENEVRNFNTPRETFP